MKRTLAVVVLVFLFGTHLNAQNRVFLDSLKSVIEARDEEDSVKVYLLLTLAKNYTSGDISKSLSAINEANSIAEKIKFNRGVGLSLNALGQYYIIKGDLDQGLIHTLKAKEILLACNDDENLLVSNSNLARIYNNTGKHDKSLAIHLQNLEIVKDAPSSPDKAGMYFYVAKTYEQLNDYRNAELYYLSAKRISNEVKFNTGVSIAQGSLGNLYNLMGKYDKAIEYLTETLEYSIQNDQISNIAAVYFSLSKSYEGLNQHDLAIRYNEKSIEIYENLKNHRLLKSAYMNHSIYHDNIGQFETSNKYLKLHYGMVDSLFSQSKVKIIEELQTKYETEMKELEIASLSQQAEIKDLEIQQKNQTIFIGLAVVLFLAILIYLIARQRSIKQQQSQTELEQRFLRSQLNPHFISNALTAVQSFMLKNETSKAAYYLAKFSKLMREILENSRHEFILVEDEIDMLTNYMDIHKLRMNDAFDYKISIDDSIDPETDTIPPMFVQPFVENAIEHGIINAKGEGLIELKFVKTGKYISIEIKDNGEGLSAQAQKSEDHKSLATTIIKERMELFNNSLKNKIQLLLSDNTDEHGEIQGTKVELKVPFSYL